MHTHIGKNRFNISTDVLLYAWFTADFDQNIVSYFIDYLILQTVLEGSFEREAHLCSEKVDYSILKH